MAFSPNPHSGYLLQNADTELKTGCTFKKMLNGVKKNFFAGMSELPVYIDCTRSVCVCPSKYLKVHKCVCPGGTPVSALSQDPGSFQNTGTRPPNKRTRQRDLSAIQKSGHTHKHTRTYCTKTRTHSQSANIRKSTQENEKSTLAQTHKKRCARADVYAPTSRMKARSELWGGKECSFF